MSWQQQWSGRSQPPAALRANHAMLQGKEIQRLNSVYNSILKSAGVTYIGEIGSHRPAVRSDAEPATRCISRVAMP